LLSTIGESLPDDYPLREFHEKVVPTLQKEYSEPAQPETQPTPATSGSSPNT